jgi:hypothetical protein
MRGSASIATGSAVVAVALLLGSGTAVAAPSGSADRVPVSSPDGGTGDSACAQFPSSLQALLCPSAGGEDEATSSSTSSDATSGTGSSATSSGGTGGTTGSTGTTTPTTGTPGAAAPGGSASGGVVSAFLAWLAGVFQSLGL